MDKKKILIVEDDADIRDILRFYLEEEGFAVLEAPNANNILKVTKESKPDLITLDIKLPGIDGPQAIKILKEDSATAAIPVLVVSVIAKDPKIQKLAVQGFIAKPFEKEELVEGVKKILSRSANLKNYRKVLVVDDEPDVVNVIADHLKARGIIPLKAFSGKEAIQKASAEKPDLIVLDIRMPQLDGFEVINILSKDQQTWSIPIIVLTGTVIAEEEKIKSKAKGVKKILNKPFESNKLIEEIQTILCEKKES